MNIDREGFIKRISGYFFLWMWVQGAGTRGDSARCFRYAVGGLCWVALQMAWTALPLRGQAVQDMIQSATQQAGIRAQVEPGKSDAEMERRLSALTSALEQTRSTLQQSLKQIEQMQSEIDVLRAAGQSAASKPPAPARGSCVAAACSAAGAASRPRSG